VIVACIALVAIIDVKNPEKLGEGAGQFATVCFVIGLGGSYCWQTGRRAGGIALFGVVGALIVGTGIAIGVGSHSSGAHFKASDREALVRYTDGGEKWLRHPTLGFSLRDPGQGFNEAPQFAAMMMSGGDKDAIYYAYADTGPNAVLVVAALPESVDSPGDLEKSLDGIERGLRNSLAKGAAAGAPFEVVTRAVDAGTLTATFHVKIGEADFRLKLFAVSHAASVDYTVMLGVMSKSSDVLANVLTELRH
jgi:hypothetical protein